MDIFNLYKPQGVVTDSGTFIYPVKFSDTLGEGRFVLPTLSQIGNLFRWFSGYGKLGNKEEITKTLDSPEMKVLRAILETESGIPLRHTVIGACNLVEVVDDLPGHDHSRTTKRLIDMNGHRRVVSDIFDMADAGCVARLSDPPIGVPLIVGLVGDEEAIFRMYFWGLAFLVCMRYGRICRRVMSVMSIWHLGKAPHPSVRMALLVWKNKKHIFPSSLGKTDQLIITL